MQNIRPFQIVLLGGFTLAAVVGVAFLAAFESDRGQDQNRFGSQVVIWGTLPKQAVEEAKEIIARENEAFDVVTYTQISQDEFAARFVDAVAEGRAPDSVLIPNSLLVTLQSKLQPISYEVFPLRDFRDRFIDGAEVFALSDGLYALPLGVDPLLLYWNRDMFNDAGIPEAPRTWETLVNVAVPQLTEFGDGRTLQQSAVAFGEAENVTNAQAILLTLAIQSGSPLITEERGQYSLRLNAVPAAAAQPPMTAALQFYTSFSDPRRALYTWNRSRPNDRQAFLAGDLALYFGFGSEYETLQLANPNLNFDVTEVPQGQSATVKRVYGDFYGFAFPRASDNLQGAYAAAQEFIGRAPVATLTSAARIAPVDRRVLSAGSGDPFLAVAYQAALTARGWYDPTPTGSNDAFTQAVNDVVAGRTRVEVAVNELAQRLRLLFSN